MAKDLNIVILGLSLSSSWGNGHATTFRHLVRALYDRGHRVIFLERDAPWYAASRDLPHPPWGEWALYDSVEQLFETYSDEVRRADLVVVGSYVPQGIEIGEWVQAGAGGVTAFYDIDTPITLQQLEQQSCSYLDRHLIPQYDLYLSFTGGPTLRQLEDQYGSPRARPLYCSVDPDTYHPENVERDFDLGYMGTYSDDRQPGLDELLIAPAESWPEGRFVVAGPQYPSEIVWPGNVVRWEHLPPAEHRSFYNRQRFTLNLTRREMRRAGYSPSIRLFEAAACGTAIISDSWPGLEDFFDIGRDLMVANSAQDSLRYLTELSDDDCQQVGRRARDRVLARHTGAHRAVELEQYFEEAFAAEGAASGDPIRSSLSS
jgi:spore maturation protein CgeB